VSSFPDVFYIAGIFILLSLTVIVAILVHRRKVKASGRLPENGAPESEKWGRPAAWGIVVAILTLASSTAIGVAQLVNSHEASSAGQNGSGSYVGESILVKDRAAYPSDIDAPGPALTRPQAKFVFTNVARVPEVITFREWNTIVATSEVPIDVNLAIDPKLNINFTATSIRRLQYLADVMGMQDDAVDVGTVGYARNSSGSEVESGVLIINGRSTSVNVTNLQVTVRNEGGSQEYLNGYFFSPQQPLFIPAKTSLFTYLGFTEKTSPSFPPANYQTQDYINWQNGD
jgi:hypothetical protein